MTADPLDALLQGTLADPDGGPALGVPTRAVEIAESLDGREADLVERLELGGRLALVSDANTHAVLGSRVVDALAGRVEVTEIRLPGRPHADDASVAAIRRASSDCDALIAVGAGTINDLCKYAAALDGKNYAVFATAPSMNGYTSVNAAITVAGHKKSLPAVAASGVFLDLEVLSKAPKRMIRSGLGDSLCRPTAQADWLLAHLLLDLPYREAPFALLAEDEAELFANSETLLRGDIDAMRALARTLVLSGFGMTLCGGSYPASQGEHLIGHYIEMMAPSDWPEAFHGEQIAVTTLTMARLQERLLDGPAPRLRVTTLSEAEVVSHFGAELGAACWAAFTPKRLDATGAEALNARLAENWDSFRAKLRTVLRPASELEDVLARARAPRRPEDLHWPPDFYREAVGHAREIRDRYTFLDLAADSGMFDDDDEIR